jgi:hypothetical protein
MDYLANPSSSSSFITDNVIVLFIYIVYFFLYYYNWFSWLFTTSIGKILLILSIFILTLYHPLIGYITAIVLIYMYHSFCRSKSYYREGLENHIQPPKAPEPVVSVASSPQEIIPEVNTDESIAVSEPFNKLSAEENIRSKPSNRYPVQKPEQSIEPFSSDIQSFISPFSTV